MNQALAELGFAQPKFGHGRIISKPVYSPPLFWHEDGRFWDDPVSYTTQPIQCFLMYYLTDTSPENGCLRVIPGSHLKRHPLHDQTSPRHTDELRTYANPDNIAFQRAAGEIDVPVKAGDLVIGFGTLFHAAHANQTDGRRTVLTMWYYPDYVDLPQPTQATVAYFWFCMLRNREKPDPVVRNSPALYSVPLHFMQEYVCFVTVDLLSVYWLVRGLCHHVHSTQCN